MEYRPSGMNLYPDLHQFYNEGVVETGSSVDLPIHRIRHPLTPTAPPQPPGLDLRLDLGDDLHFDLDDLDVPDEPELDYTLEIEPDYDDTVVDDPQTPDTLNNLNLTAREKRILHDKNIEVPQQPRDSSDFRAWIKWRTQANKLLAAVILIRQGRHVCLRQSEIERQPLSEHNVLSIVKDAKGDRGCPRPGRDHAAEWTSLSDCPYIMYGIPRVRLPSAGKR
ncbi:hypothetical protein ACOMHN_037279 [Nucella lapillus]